MCYNSRSKNVRDFWGGVIVALYICQTVTDFSVQPDFVQRKKKDVFQKTKIGI